MARTSSSASLEPHERKVFSRIDHFEHHLTQLTCRLCAIPTVNPPGDHYLDCAQLLAAELRRLGLAVRIVRVPARVQAELLPDSQDYPRYNVIARWDVGAAKTLHFNGHYDVVPPTAGWKTDPFQPLIRGRRIIARGAGDMKGSIASAIIAVRALVQSRLRPPWNIELSFTPDEETGGELGLGYLVKTKAVRPDAAVVCEGGGEQSIGYAHRGVLWLDVTTIGKAGHACAPKHGVNALESACSLIADLKTLEKAFAARPTPFRTDKPSERPPTIMIGGISAGGGKTNTIPDRFHFTIDRRINPEESLADVRAELMAVIRRAKRRRRKLKTSVEPLLYVAPGSTPLDSPICRAAAAAVRSVRRKPPRFRLCLGFTDMHFLTRDARVPTIMYGAYGGGGHGDGEYVSIPDLLRTAKVYAAIALRMPADPSPG